MLAITLLPGTDFLTNERSYTKTDTLSRVPDDPYLQYKPEFARSLPVQTLVTGVVFTLVAVLFVHIVFTGQYHWPLAPVNYALQLSGVVSLLVSLIATIHVIFSSAITESQHWPYMLSYIAVNVPPLDMLNVAPDPDSDTPAEITWSPVERGTWLMMNAAVSALAQITHIQFLTLLFPSRLEGRLIYCLLGPLAILAAIMQLIPIQANTNLISIANEIRNICNATLSLLFTASLFIWGLLVNRSQAWRTDGGTAVFGASALGLAMVSTALNFLYVPKNEEYVWLPGLIWAVILWQSFLGWWWWVGAGSGQSTEDVVEQMLKRGEKIAKKRRKAKSKKDHSTRSRRGTGSECSGQEHEHEHAASASGRSSVSDDSTTRRRTFSAETSTETPSVRPRARRTHSNGSATSMSTEDSITTLPRFFPQTVHTWYNNLRQAHVTAARRQTVERVERIREIERGRTEGIEPIRGWGLGSFGWRVGRSNAAAAEYAMERMRRRSDDHEQHSESEDELKNIRSLQSLGKSNKRRNTSIPTRGSHVEGSRRKSIWWWGPFNRWRLQDTTAYH
ncbi:hypothetical protein F5050DRAFT_1575516 [Lentinula boryana]|uniref:PalH-domain-containing protein n=1 Tax=Lentinula boryana TaxID=40481 RepID=A0ABQ8Q7S0_9AGAR|nr:hypothetical protein F5050DRAFT_1575516 [Lentinula boryana]